MKKWEDFESEMTGYLQQMLKDYDVLIKQYGSADSTIPDIEITINSNSKKFYIETKMPASQTSQFVVEIKDDKFVYGSKNKFKANQYSDEIINILNDNFKLYSKVAQTGMVVPVPETIAFSWIASNMKNKNVEFIISVDNDGNKKVSLMQQDIVNLQLAKAAVKTGIELLMIEGKVDKLDGILIAGAFGSNLDIDNIKSINMIPNIENENIHILGNAAGSGAIQILLHKDKYNNMNEVIQNTRHVELANHKDFNRIFADSLML